MRKILLLLLFVVLAGCATLELNTNNTITVTDKKGNEYKCVVDYANPDNAGAVCSFFVQKKDTVFKCTVDFHKRKTFTLDEDCKVEIKMTPNTQEPTTVIPE